MAKKKTLSYEDLIKIKSTFKKIKGDKSKLGLTLIDEAIFCGETLQKLKQKVEDEGVITEMSQGNYTIDRENPALKSYNTTIKNYQNLIKQINELLEESKDKTASEDELELFCK